MHGLVATALTTFDAVNIESLYCAFKKTFVIVLPGSFYRVAVDPPTDPPTPCYNQRWPATHKIPFLNSYKGVLALFD